MVPIKEALTFDDVTLVPKYSEILPSGVDTSIKLTESLKLKIPLLSSAMDTVTESRMAIALAKAGGLGVIHRNLDIKKQVLEIRKVKKQRLVVGAAVGAGLNEFKRAEAILKEKIDMIVVDTAHGHTKKVAEIIKFIKKKKDKKTSLCAGNIATTEAAKFLNEWPTIVELPAYKCEKSKNLDEFKQTLDEYLSKVPDEPKCDGLSPGATNVQSGRPTKTIIYQVVRRKEAWSDTVQELDPTTSLYSNLL